MATLDVGDYSHVTIVVTTKDRGILPHKAIASALRQTHTILDVVVIDDGSTQPFVCQATDPRVRVLRNESSLGVCNARNQGLEVATGQWIVFLDDDDELVDDMIERALEAVSSSKLPPPVATLSIMHVVDENGVLLETRKPVTAPRGGTYFLEARHSGYHLQTQNSLMAPLRLVRDIGGWDPNLHASEHDDFMLRLNQVCSLQAVEKPGYRLLAHNYPRLSRHELYRAEGMTYTYRKHREVFLVHRQGASNYLSGASRNFVRSDRWGKAIALAARSITLDPRNRHAWLALVEAGAGPRIVRLARGLRALRK